MAEETGSIGERLDLSVRAGDTLGPFTLTIKDSTGAGVNITGYTFEGAVSKLNTDDGLIALTCTILDAANGVVEFKVTDTAPLADNTSDFFRASSTYSWYLKGTAPAGHKQTYLFGYLKVAKELPT